jgi:dienelactone hydrolase
MPVVLAAALQAGCGGKSAPSEARRSAEAPAALAACRTSTPGWQRLRVADGPAALDAAVLGHGRLAIVFANDSRNQACTWLPFARELADRGMQVALFEYASVGNPDEVRATAAALRRNGARRVIAVGASVGARSVIELAAKASPGVDAVVSLSAERQISLRYRDILPAARHVRLPSLYVGSREDGYTSFGKETIQLHDATPASTNELLLVPGDDHGVDLLAGRNGGRVRSAVLRFASAAGKQATSTTTTAPASTAAGRCDTGGVRGQAVRFRTSDGVTLSGAVVGSGPVGAVLIHQYPRDSCGWWPYAGYLSRHGVRALLFDLRCFGRSACPNGRGHATADVAAAVSELRRQGVRRVALVGASMGGAIAVVAAARLHPAAVVDLSGERDTTGLTPGIDADAGAAAHGITAPALFAVARGDRYVPVADMRAVARRVRSATTRVIVLPAIAGHGWDMLFGVGTEWSPLAATVAAFIRHHAGRRRD